MHSYKIIINFTPLLLTKYFIIMYLEQDELLSKEQEQDVLDIWRKSINEFPFVRIKKLKQYCEQNNCDISVAIDLLYCYLQSDYTCVVDDLFYFFCGDVIMEEYFFTEDKQCHNKVNYEYILENDPCRYVTLPDYEDDNEFVPDFQRFLFDYFTDRIESKFKNNFTSFKDIDEMYEYYYKYFEKVDELFFNEQYYDIKERKIDLSEINKKMMFPSFVQKISRKKIEEDLKILDIESEKENYKLTKEECEIKDDKFISNYYRDFLSIFGQGGHLSDAFDYVVVKNNMEDDKFMENYLSKQLGDSFLTKEEIVIKHYIDIINTIDGDFKYILKKNRMCVIDEIDNILTICQDMNTKNKRAKKIINDFASISALLQLFEKNECSLYSQFYTICYERKYIPPIEYGITMYIFDMISIVYTSFIDELFSIFDDHEINIAVIQKECGNSIFDEEYYDIGEFATLNENSNVRNSVKSNMTTEKITEMFNYLVPKYAECEINTLLALFGKGYDNGAIIIWKGSKVELEVFLRQTIEEEQSSRNRMGLPRKKIEKWFSYSDGTIIRVQKKMSCYVESYHIYKDVFDKLSTL